MDLHENKPNPEPIESTKIVEAFGLRKCPKLVEQCCSEALEVRVNALAVLCDEFRNPYSIYGCAEAGIIKVLARMVTDSDYITRVRATRALAIAAEDANGLGAILIDEAISDIIQGLRDPAAEVRENVYLCFYHCSRTADGLEAVVNSGAIKAFARAVSVESDSLKPIMLQAIHNACSIQKGLQDSLDASAVKVCIQLLLHDSDAIAAEAARTLGFLSFSEQGKEDALSNDAIGSLVVLLNRTTDSKVQISATTALMAVTTTDEGKRQMLPSDGAPVLVGILTSQKCEKSVKMNILKIISNIAVYPPIRMQLKSTDKLLEAIRLMIASGDKFIEKHAKAALDAVLWSP